MGDIIDVSNPSTVAKYSGEVAAARNHQTTNTAPNVIPTPVIRWKIENTEVTCGR